MQGKTGRQIAEELNFGVPGTAYKKVKPEYFYYYRQKFKLPPYHGDTERRPPFAQDHSRYKNKKEEVMPFDQFSETLDAQCPLKEGDYWFNFNQKKRAYLILHYWTPLRASEIYERTLDNFKVKDGKLIISLLRKKKKHKPTDKDEPVRVPLNLPLMNEVIEWLGSEKWKDEDNPDRPFPLSKITAWRWISSVFEGYYPHYFRFNWITSRIAKGANLVQLKAATRLNLSTLNAYVMAPDRQQDELYDIVVKEAGGESFVEKTQARN